AFDKGPLVYQALAPVMGDSLLNSAGAVHHAHRQALAPAFAPRRRAGYAATMTRCAAESAAGWSPGTSLALAPTLRRLTLRIMGDVLFGAAAPPLDDLAPTIAAAVDHIGVATRRLLPLPAAWPGGCAPATRSTLRRFRQRIGAVVATRRAAGAGGDDLLACLLQAGWSDAAIVDELRMFLVIGHETPANALTWCFDLLARHPAVAARLRAELAAVLQGRLPTPADLAALPYTRQVIQETLRLYPPAWMLGRIARRPVDLPGCRIPRGGVILVPIAALHRRADRFPDPAAFQPERWTPAFTAALPRYAYMPFGAGPRACLAQHFALLELHLLLATLAARVVFTPVPGPPLVPDIRVTLRPAGRYPVTVQRIP
ncbi:MAG: cytochrome P450, partial [Chloroflexota bacterium]|nr:cytochrome P450 [Chloroflexota bacterium]